MFNDKNKSEVEVWFIFETRQCERYLGEVFSPRSLVCICRWMMWARESHVLLVMGLLNTSGNRWWSNQILSSVRRSIRWSNIFFSFPFSASLFSLPFLLFHRRISFHLYATRSPLTKWQRCPRAVVPPVSQTDWNERTGNHRFESPAFVDRSVVKNKHSPKTFSSVDSWIRKKE